MIQLKNFSFKKIIFLLSTIMFTTLATSYTFSMHYIFSNAMNNQMHLTWKNQIDAISEQVRFSIITESKKEILRIVELMHTPQIEHLSIYTINDVLYSSGKQDVCQAVNGLTDSSISNDDFICFNKQVTNKNNNQKIGYIIMIVSKREVNTLVTKSLILNSGVTFLLTSAIFGLLYFSLKKILSPLEDLSTAMKNISKNGRNIRLKKEGTKEMRSIQKTFNHMINTIEKHEESLDKKVAERTFELSKAYQDAKGASKVKSDILKIVSHEMKTPLTSAVIYLDLMESGDGYFISEIRRYHDRLEQLIENILIHANAVNNNVVLNKTLFSVPLLLSETKEEFTPLIKARNNHLKLYNTYEKYIYSDKNLIKQILINFISNANKFTSEGDITIKCHVEKNNLLFSVIDRGCGISEDNLKKIFDPFWQVDMSSARKYEGTGLGLSICYLFSETLNGVINVESKLNQGSVFTLTLPLQIAS